MDCPEIHDWVLLCHGELSENQARAFRAHRGECRRCAERAEEAEQLLRDLAAPAPIPEGGTARAVAQVMARIDDYERQRRVPNQPSWKWWGGVGAAAALALGIVSSQKLFRDLLTENTSLPAPTSPGDEFAARGRPLGLGLRQQVGIRFYALESRAASDSTLRLLEPGARVHANTAYTVSYRDLGGVAPAYLMALGVDSKNVVHWIYPAYTSPDQDPASVLLVPNTQEIPMPESVVLEAPARGPLRLFAILTRQPLRVGILEALRGDELQLSALRQRFPEADIRETTIEIE